MSTHHNPSLDQYIDDWLSGASSSSLPASPPDDFDVVPSEIRLLGKGRKRERSPELFEDLETISQLNFDQFPRFNPNRPPAARFGGHILCPSQQLKIPLSSSPLSMPIPSPNAYAPQCGANENNATQLLENIPPSWDHSSRGAGAESVLAYSPSVSSTNSRIPLKSKLEAFEFQCIPAFTFHEMPAPAQIPPAVVKLSKQLSVAASGCGSIPSSLRHVLESNNKLAMEAFAPFLWDDTPDIPELDADSKLWDRVQDIVYLTQSLRETKAEESAYYGLVQSILGGTGPCLKE